MKLFIKILIIVLAILVLLFSAARIFVALRGKALLTQKLEDALKKDVSIGYLGLRKILALEIRGLTIEKLAKIDYIYASPSLSGLLRGKIILNELRVVRPEINWERRLSADEPSKNEPISTGKALSPAQEAPNQSKVNTSKTENRRSTPIVIKSLNVKQGTISFIDRTVSESGVRIILKEVLLDVDNLYLFPKSVFTNFQLTAKIPWQGGSEEGSVYASGWINLYKKDMQARLEIDGIDGIQLYPYYSYWVDLENSRIEKANLNFSSDIQGLNNEITAQCRLELTDIKFKPRPPDQPEHNAEKVATTVLGIFRALNQGRIVLNFTIKTKMDKPEFKLDSISQAVNDTISKAVASDKVKIEDVVLLPGRLLEGVAKGTTGATKAIIDGALSVGKSFKDAILDALKTDKTEFQQDNFSED